MDLSSYLRKGESVVCSADAYRDLDDSSGTLALTGSRLVFVKGDGLFSTGTLLDVPSDAVDAIEYQEPSFAGKYLNSALAVAAVAIALFVFRPEIQSHAPVPIPELVVPILVIGLVLAGLSLYFRRARLVVHTASETFEFTARGSSLSQFPNSLRKQR